VGLSQSAASHALGRLREMVGDPLLVRGARGAMTPTPRAVALEGPVRRALGELGSALRAQPAFDAARARRTFRLAASDYAEVVLLPALLERLLIEAPGIDLWVVSAGEGFAEELADGTVDLALAPLRGDPRAGLYQRRLFDEKFMCVVRAGHPLASQRMTLNRYLAYPHVLIAPRGRPGSWIDDHLESMGKRRRIAVGVPHFLVAPYLLGRSDLILTVAARMAEVFGRERGVAVVDPPLEMPGFTLAAWWHERTHHDAAHRYLREQLAAVAV
jgi:DNA-binding transcriptional LysR family regulator